MVRRKGRKGHVTEEAKAETQSQGNHISPVDAPLEHSSPTTPTCSFYQATVPGTDSSISNRFLDELGQSAYASS